MPQHWLIKSEPSEYSYAMLERDGRTEWTGIRNFQARNHLREMKPKDLALYYHTGDEKQVVAIARIASTPHPDPTAPGEDWTSVEVVPHKRLARAVPLSELKKDPALKNLALLKQGRLSVVKVSPEEFRRIVELGSGPSNAKADRR